MSMEILCHTCVAKVPKADEKDVNKKQIDGTFLLFQEILCLHVQAILQAYDGQVLDDSPQHNFAIQNQ